SCILPAFTSAGKEMGTPLLVITRNGSILDVDDRFGKRHWRGDMSHPPSSLIGWVALVDALSAAPHMPDGTNEVHSGTGWTALYNIQDKKLKTLDLSSDMSAARYRLVL
ncbi:MAG: hypothetical protein ABI615_04470, partial [Chthoniobacterales bacterium]